MSEEENVMDLKHTPKPWIMEHDENEGTVTVWAGSAINDRHTGMYEMAGEMQLYSTVYLDGEDGNESDEECLANGRLIAAAPEMAEELGNIHVGTTITTVHFNRIQRLLDRAVRGVED